MNTLTALPEVHAVRKTRLVHSYVDWAAYGFIVLIGAFQLAHYPHAADFMSDVSYPDLARSLVEHGTYQIRLLPETTLPPGLPFILALVGKFIGFSPAVDFGVIAICATLGVIAAYELLRRVEGRAIAVIACLLLASYPAFFGFNTEVVFPEMPFLLASMAALLLARKIDRGDRGPLLFVRVLSLGLVLALAVLIRSVGIALLAGLACWIVASFAFDAKAARRRAFRFALPLAFGLAAQFGWSLWAHHHQVVEWQLPGYPSSYFSQLAVKNGHIPELGLARASDIPVRIERNTVSMAAGISHSLVRRNVSEFWSSPAIFGVVFVIAVGLLSSLRNGGKLQDWYFVCYEFIFVLWPWDYRDRFLMPIFPLVCLYLWRGAKAIKSYFIRQPKKANLVLVFLASLLCINSAALSLGFLTFPANSDHARGDHLQAIAATLFWSVLLVVGLALIIAQGDRAGSIARIVRVVEPALPPGFLVVAGLALAFAVGSGVKAIIAIGYNRSNLDITREYYYPVFEASIWIRSQGLSNDAVMAREPEFVFHYTHQTAVWFPPISNPRVLMEGIRRYHIRYVVVTHRPNSYWLPTEETCFQALDAAYPGVFQLRHSSPDEQVFEVESAARGR